MSSFSLDNAPESEITGFDANLRFANDSGFYGQASVSVLESEVTDATGSEFIAGAHLASAPELSLTALAAQEFSVGEGVLTLMANVSHTDEQASETLTSALQPVKGAFTVDSSTLLNANVSYRFGNDEQYRLAVYGHNLTDEHFCHGIRASDTANLSLPSNAGRHHGNLTCMVSNASVRNFGVTFGLEF